MAINGLLPFPVILFLWNLSSAFAQDLEPRAYTNIPRGLNFVLAGYSYSQGGVVFDPTIPLENADIHIHGTVFAWARSIKVGPMSGKVDVILPYGWLSGSAEYDGQTVTRVVSGLADPRIRMSVNFIGAPSLPLSGFKDYKQNFVLGGSLQVFLPLGQYDPLRLVNLGTNRYSL
ncbi:MAG: transporter [Marinilabiliales bacterium]|nr:transporter [Marinilabiliales bacterium]